MTPLLKLQMKQSETRKALSTHMGIAEETRADDWGAKLSAYTGQLGALDDQVIAQRLLEADPEERQTTDDPASREWNKLLADSNVGNIFAASVEHRATSGREAELQTHLGLNSNQIPFDMLRPAEHRAVTTSPTNVGVTQQPIVQPVFAMGDAAYMGVSMPTVAVGDATFPVLTSRPIVGGPHDDASETTVAETTGAFDAEALSPNRLQASFLYKRVDVARFSMMGEALRMALNSGLSEKLDAQMMAQIVTDVTRTASTAVATFQTYQSQILYGQVDGRFATMESELKFLIGTETLVDMATLYKSAQSPENFPSFLRRMSGGVRVSPHVAAAVSNKQDILIRKGARMDAVAPIWNGITLIPDEVTQAGKGQIIITAVMLANFKVIRTGGFDRIQVQHS